MRLASCSFVLVTAAACHGGATAAPGNRGGGAEPPADLLTRAKDAARPIFVRDGVPYLWLHAIQPYADEPEWTPDLPACTDDDAGCWQTVPAPAERTAAFGPLPASLTVITAKGTCVAKVEPIVIVNTSGCDPSMAYGAPLTGCGAELATVGFAGGDVDRELRWLPAPGVKGGAVPADLTTLADPVQRQYLTRWLATEPFREAHHETRTAVVSVDAGAEALSTIVLGALVGDSGDHCDWSVADERALGLRRGDQFSELQVVEAESDGYAQVVSEWDGALAWGDRIVGIVSGQPRSVRLDAIGPGGASTNVLDQTIWWDNEECLQGTWSGIEYPCGP